MRLKKKKPILGDKVIIQMIINGRYWLARHKGNTDNIDEAFHYDKTEALEYRRWSDIRLLPIPVKPVVHDI